MDCLDTDADKAKKTLIVDTLPFIARIVPSLNFIEYAAPDWQKYAPSSSLLTFFMFRWNREPAFVRMNLELLNCPWSVISLWTAPSAMVWTIYPNFILYQKNNPTLSPDAWHVRVKSWPSSASVWGIWREMSAVWIRAEDKKWPKLQKTSGGKTENTFLHNFLRSISRTRSALTHRSENNQSSQSSDHCGAAALYCTSEALHPTERCSHNTIKVYRVEVTLIGWNTFTYPKIDQTHHQVPSNEIQMCCNIHSHSEIKVSNS